MELLARVGLRPDMVRQATAGLSGGEAQRVCFARCLAVGPEVLLADEPTSVAGPQGLRAEVEEVIHTLAHSGLSVVLVSHDLAQAQRVADAGVLLEHGTVASPERAAGVPGAGRVTLAATLRPSSVPVPSWWGVALSVLLVVVAGAVVLRERLGLARELAWPRSGPRSSWWRSGAVLRAAARASSGCRGRWPG